MTVIYNCQYNYNKKKSKLGLLFVVEIILAGEKEFEPAFYVIQNKKPSS